MFLVFRPNPTGRTGLPPNALLAIDGQEESFAKESAELPDNVIIVLLKREHLLTRAKLNALYYEHITGERKLRSLKTQLRQVQQPASASIRIQCQRYGFSRLWHSNSMPSDKRCSCLLYQHSG